MENMPNPRNKEIDRPEDDEENGQCKRSYYYDDAHGYEDFNTEGEDDDEFED